MTSTAGKRDIDSSRLNTYFDMQYTFDHLNRRSANGENFHRLYDIITSDKNIKLAIASIRGNSGSKTPGTDGKNVLDYMNYGADDIMNMIRLRLTDFQPQSVRRVMIDKPGTDKKRPLGIPTFEDRIIQQMFKQVLEPIVEAKFHQHSYGFRPLKGANNAIFRVQNLINKQFHYFVDIDIKGFFDNIDHKKLLKQIYAMGIRDKKVISIIKKMLKAEIAGEGVPTKGTPQGGILSPLLSNIVLNELDWWLHSQWHCIKPNEQVLKRRKNPVETEKMRINFIQDLRVAKQNGKIKLKEFYFVRYADDFKIACKNMEDAEKIFIATKMWLKDRLNLDISEEKSTITNVRKKPTEFLGFSLRGRPRYIEKRTSETRTSKHTYVRTKVYYCVSSISPKAIKRIKTRLALEVKRIKADKSHRSIEKFNAYVRGIQNYYKYATNISIDLQFIAMWFHRKLYNQLKYSLKKSPSSKFGGDFAQRYGVEKYPVFLVYEMAGIPLYPIHRQKTENAKASTKHNIYTEEGREALQGIKSKEMRDALKHLVRYPLRNESIELNLNRHSLFSQQKGLCGLSALPLEISNFDVHHKLPRTMGGTDTYRNLVLLNKEMHRLVHTSSKDEALKILNKHKLKKRQFERLNHYRDLAGNTDINTLLA